MIVDQTDTLWNGLLANLATVALLTMTWTHVMQYIERWTQVRRAALFGATMGLGAIIVMLMPFETGLGYRLDHRFTMIAASGFFGGPLSLLITAGMAAAFRLYIGGVGIWIGLLGITVSSVIGIAGYFLSTRRSDQHLWHIVAFAVAVPMGVIAGLFVLPPEFQPTTRPDIAIPLAITIFMATLLCALAIYQENRRLAMIRRNAIYEAIINALPDCLNVKDLEGRFIAANPATADLMRAAVHTDLIGKTDFDFYDAETASQFRIDETQILASGIAATVKQSIVRKDGTLTWLATLKAPLRDEDGVVIGMITHNRDVTEEKRLERDLQQARQTLDDAITNMKDGMVIYDRAGRMTFCNEQYQRLFPLTSDIRVPGAMLEDVMRESVRRGERMDGGQANAEWLSDVHGELFRQKETVVEIAGGRWIHTRTVAVETGILLMMSDITETKTAELDRESSAREYRALFENSLAGIFRSTPEGTMLRANPALARLSGFDNEQQLIEAVNDLALDLYIDPGRREEFKRLMNANGRVSDFVSEIYRLKSRERIWIAETAWSVYGLDGELVCYEGTVTEITDRKLAEEELARANIRLLSLSRTDGLTGLANRRVFDESIAAEFERARTAATPLSVLMVDVDHFKRFNDTYGHTKGDECLRLLARALATVPRGYGDQACRYGGEEMAVLLPDTDMETAEALADRFCSAVRGLSIEHVKSDMGLVTVSVGVATMGTSVSFETPEALVEAADKALYEAKATGRDKVVLAAAA